MQLFFGCPHVRPLLDQLRRQADRKYRRQVQLGKPESLARCFSWKRPRQRGNEVACLRERLAQRRQSSSCLRERGFLQSEVVAIGKSSLELTPDGFEHLLIDRDDLFDRLDLPAQRGFSDHRNNQISGQRQVGGLSLEALHVAQGFERFYRATIEPPDVERISDFELRGDEVEYLRAIGRHWRQRRRRALAGRVEIGLSQRKELALLRIDGFFRR